MNIIKYFNQLESLPEEVMFRLDKIFKLETYRKGDIILTAGNLSQNLIFIEKGLIRLFYEKDEKDITFLFLDENSFSMPIESIIKNTPTPYGWEALEDCTIRVVNFQLFNEQLEQFPPLEKIARFVLFEALLNVSNRLTAIQFQTAEQRYNNLLETYPNILQRASLYNISTYLGITQQTLSVIRAKFKQGNKPNNN
jgi:CRP-like cAMP-binding protein